MAAAGAGDVATAAGNVAVVDGPIVINSFEEVSSAVSAGEASDALPTGSGDDAGSEMSAAGVGAVEAVASTGENAVTTRGFGEEFDYSRWGYASYEAYRTEHPLWARITYARLWTGRALQTIQPTGCSQCSRKHEEPASDAVPADIASPVIPAVEKPASGFVFESAGKGRNPQLTVKAPETADAFVKLRDVETGETYLSFYVGAGTTVAACVPAKECLVYYALGETWLGPDEAFGDQGIYAKSNERLKFADPGNTYTYALNVEGGNISPIMIDKTEFC